jgi:hypothetical protein
MVAWVYPNNKIRQKVAGLTQNGQWMLIGKYEVRKKNIETNLCQRLTGL